MKYLLTILLVIIGFVSQAGTTDTVPSSSAITQFSTGTFKHGVDRHDSGNVSAVWSDTNFIPRWPGFRILRRTISDTSEFFYTGQRWKQASQADISGLFIQNQNSSDQTANYRITGQGRFGNGLITSEFNGGGDDGFYSIRATKTGITLNQRFKRAFQDYSSVLPSSTSLGYIGFEAFGRIEGAGAVAQGYIASFAGRPTFDVTGGATLQKMYGVYIGALSKNGATDTVFGFYNAELNNPAFTGTTPTVNAQFAFFSESLTKATNNWGVYINGAQKNYFGGAVGILTNNPTTKLHVAGTGLFTDTLTITTMGNSDSSNRAASTAWVKRQGYGSGSSGITTLNTLTAATQTFAVGTAGTDFAISSATSTHTFNLPTASATNRGALSTTDWSTFNAKIGPSDTAAITSRAWRTNGNNMAGVTGLFGTTSNDNLTIITNNLTRGFISAGGTFVWGAATATAGFKVDLHGRTLIFTSPTGQNELLVDDDGVNGQLGTTVLNPSGSNNVTLLLTGLNNNIISGRAYGSSTEGFAIGGRNSSSTIGYFGILNSAANTATSGDYFTLKATNVFNPTSGTATLFVAEDARTINQTGGASGITRFAYAHPTLTAAADYRAFENTVGNNLFNSTSGNSNFGGTLSYATTVSSAGTLTIGSSIVYIFSGTTTTWTLPAVSGTTGRVYFLKSRGSGNITLNSNSGSEIYDTAAQTGITIIPGQAIILISDGTYWTVN